MANRKPNIIFLVLDTLRAERMSLYGYEKDTTPVLGELSTESTVFDWGIATAPWTIPSHASMFTGQYPTVHQTTQSYAKLPESLPTVAELLRDNGYATVGFCNNPLVGVLDNDLERGFNEFFNYSATIPDMPRIGKETTTRQLQRKATEFLKSMTTPIEREFGRSPLALRLAMLPLLTPLWTRMFNFKGNTRRSLHDITAYLRHHHNTEPDTPLFMFINMMETHLPYYPPRRIVDRWVPYLKQDREARNFLSRFNTESYRWVAPMIDPFSEKEQVVLRDVYDAEIAYQDRQLNRMFRFLRRSGEIDNTMIVVVSDHGESHGDHDFMGHAFVLYNELVHVPLMIHYPEMFPRGARIDHEVSTRRLYHTMLEAAGIQHESYGHTVEELSLTQSLNGKAGEPDDEIVVSEGFPPLNFVNVMEMNNPDAIEEFRVRMMRRAIYDGGHKLMTVSERPDEFFDVHKDYAEETNLLDNPFGYENNILSLEKALEAFVVVQEAHRDGTAAGETLDYSNNPELLERLRSLGYIE